MALDRDDRESPHYGDPRIAPPEATAYVGRSRLAHTKPETRGPMPDALKVRVLVRPKEGILDPQGEAVRGALPALGFGGVKTVRIGRLVEMEVESADEVDAMCRRLLSNPTIEEYEWEVVS